MLFEQAEEQPGFPNALLDVLEAEQDNGVRQSGMHHAFLEHWPPEAY